MVRRISVLLCLSMIFLLSACTENQVYAPVITVSGAIDAIPKSGVHRVSSGETLYSIAWRYGKDYRYLAKLNRISAPYAIFAGQRIYLEGRSSSMKIAESSPRSFPVEKESMGSVNVWRWPAQGALIGTFSESNKGINIAGKLGSPIFASAPGKVVYSGSGLRGYGNLIIIKHNSLFLSAYAHNDVVYVKEGDSVTSGQTIARMGNTGTKRIMLHFEIRKGGQPVNPLSYLETR